MEPLLPGILAWLATLHSRGNTSMGGLKTAVFSTCLLGPTTQNTHTHAHTLAAVTVAGLNSCRQHPSTYRVLSCYNNKPQPDCKPLVPPPQQH